MVVDADAMTEDECSGFDDIGTRAALGRDGVHGVQTLH